MTSVGIWLDLDRDGIFESSTAENRADRGGTGGVEPRQLHQDLPAVGDYLIVFTHRE